MIKNKSLLLVLFCLLLSVAKADKENVESDLTKSTNFINSQLKTRVKTIRFNYEEHNEGSIEAITTIDGKELTGRQIREILEKVPGAVSINIPGT